VLDTSAHLPHAHLPPARLSTPEPRTHESRRRATTRPARRARLALAGGLALVGIAVGGTLVQAPTVTIATDGIAEETEVAGTRNAAKACQAGETVPAGTTAIRLALAAELGPPVTVTVLSRGILVAHGTRGPGWTDASVTVPVRRVARTIPDARVCFKLGDPIETVAIFGRKTAATGALSSGAQQLPGRVAIEYVRTGSSSWLSLVPSIARRMGLGHAWGGTWIVFALVAAMAGSVALLCRMLLRELG
jgi:hypothetical protein